MQLKLVEASQMLDQIQKSSFCQSLDVMSQCELVTKLFNMIDEQENQLEDEDKIKLIENQSFLEMFSILQDYNVVYECKSAQYVLDQVKVLLEDFSSSQIKLGELRKLLKINLDSLLKFLDIVKLNIDKEKLELTQASISKQDKQVIGLKQFAYLMEDLDVAGHKQMNEFVKDYFSKNLEIKLEEFNMKGQDIPTYKCLDFLYKLSHITLAYCYVKNSLVNLKNENKHPQNDLELDEQILLIINQLKEHIIQLNNYQQQQNDTLTLKQIFSFWRFTFKGGEAPQKCQIYLQIKEVANYFNGESQVVAVISEDNPFLQHIVNLSLHYRNKDTIYQLANAATILGFQQNQKYEENYTSLQALNNQLINLDVSASKVEQPFSEFITQIEEVLPQMLNLLPIQDKYDILQLVSLVKNSKMLIEYLNQLDKDRIQLEDLIDVIDDTSMETDVLVQEMMNVRNALQLMRAGEETQPDLINCLVKRYKKYDQNIKKNDKLQNIITRCIDNLELIRLKIQNQSDRSAKTIQTIKSLKSNILIQIERQKITNESVVTFRTENQLSQKKEVQVLSSEDLNLLCNRYRLIKSSKKKDNQIQQQQQQLQQQQMMNEDQDEGIYQQLIEVLTLSEEMRQILDNLRNLGHTQFTENEYIQKHNLTDIIPILIQDLEIFKLEDSKNIKRLLEAREKYLSLNFYPPYSFQLIERLKKCIKNANESEMILDQLHKLTKFINENEEPNVEQLKQYLIEQTIKNDVEGLDFYGNALDILLKLPKVELIANKPQELDRVTKGESIECKRIKSYDLLLKSIVTVFLAHNQKPTSWQIFFCSSKTQIHDLEQFAYLAKNAANSNVYTAQQPLFLICQFQSLSLIIQRQFIDKLEELYDEQQSINLLITYVGNFDAENSMHILQQFKYAFEVDSKMKDADLISFSKIESFNTISMHISRYSGFGKTFQIMKRCRQDQQEIIEIPLYGETTQLELINLIKIKLSNMEGDKQRIHLNLYDLKSDDIHSILFQLLILRKLSITPQNFVQIPPKMQIEIEIQNSFQDTFEQKIKYLIDYLLPANIFKYELTAIEITLPIQKTIYGADINNFEIENNPNINYDDIQLALQYLKSVDKISNFQVQDYDEKQKQNNEDYKKNIISQKEAISLIKQYFLYQVDKNISFYHVTSILKFFTKQANLFHKTIYLDMQQLDFQQIDRTFRQKVFQGIINTAVPYSCQIMSNNYDSYEQQQVKIPYFDALEQRNKNIKGWDDNLGQADDFFLTISQSGSLVPIFQNFKSVPKYYVDYCRQIQNPVQDWDNLKNIREDVLINLCTPARNIEKVKEDLKQNYNDIAITKTIARKICFLHIKINSDIPTLIMGETGVGKTILVRYLSSLIDGAIFTLNVHAGLTQNEIISWVNFLIQLNNLTEIELDARFQALENDITKDIENENEELHQEKEIVRIFVNFRISQVFKDQDFNETKVILFFDEINTNQNIDGILKELLVDRKIQGKKLPSNFVPIAAANPYKFKTADDQQENTDSLKIAGCENSQTSKLVYHVYPLAESMNTFIWQFGELLPEDEFKIVNQMISNATLTLQQLIGFQKTLLQTITGCQQFSRQKQSIRSVSLRDVSRFLKVFKHFLTDPVWKKDLSDALLLSIFYSYYCRFNHVKLREDLCYYLEEKVKENKDEVKMFFVNNVRDIVNVEMDKIQDIINTGESYKSIAFTSTLKENLFMTLISILNKIPIIMVGPPGSSKTLCTRLLYNSMKGNKSSIDFFKNLPNLMYKTYQCSILSTSDSIAKAFNSAKQLDNNIKRTQNEQQDGAKNIVSLILDEIGLAEASKTNPLKVLHRLLEDQTNVPMIGLSNWSLDASKMNRVVFANRPKLSEIELIEAAIALQKRIHPKLEPTIVINLAKDSFNYFSRNNNKTFFHGTRDFYNCVTYVCTQLSINKDQSEDAIQKIIITGILRNFGGSKDINESLSYFKLSLGPNVEQLYEFNINQFNPTSLINMNINDNNCRNLMIIANKPDHALQYTERLCKDRQYKIFQGSDLQDDFTEYNTLKMLNEIITCMEEGYLVIMYSLENLYQSFYDLFNQNYVELGAKNFCRIAIGSDSIRSRVHPNFKVIIIAQSNHVYGQGQNYDPPLLNRFEKQYLDLKYLLNDNDILIKKKIQQFIQDCSEVKSDRGLLLKRIKWEFNIQDMFPIVQEKNKDDMLFSLTLKNNDCQNEMDRLSRSLYELIDLSNFSGIVRSHFLKKLDKKYYNHYINSKYHFDFNMILKHLQMQFENSQNRMTDLNDIDEMNEEYEVVDDQEMDNEQINKIGQNLIIYTPEFNHTYDSSQQIKQRTFLELELKWLDNANSLKQLAKNFFTNQEQINLIIISNIQDSMTKILYVKRLLQEERHLFEQQQSETNQKLQKNVIIVIQLVNQQTNFTGLSFDKFWRQIYIENTSSPIHKYDDITNYLMPIQVIMQNGENQIYQMILQETLPKIFALLNFDGANLTEQNLKERLKVYQQLLANDGNVSKELNIFIKDQIIERIQLECDIYNKMKLPCQWYELVSIKDKENRNNNKFISSLKQYIIQQSLSVLLRFFYQAEQCNLISSIMSGLLDIASEQDYLNVIITLWQQRFKESSDQDRNCDQINITYPFFITIKQSIDQFKLIYLEIINAAFQIEERKQIRINGEDETARSDKHNNDDDNALKEEDQIDDHNNQHLRLKNKVGSSILEINQSLVNLTSVNDQQIKYIAQINPKIYFDNLHHEIEYQWIENNILKRIVEKIIACSVKNVTVESYHSLLWVNESMFVQLSPIWSMAEQQSPYLTSRIFFKFEQRLETILIDKQGLKNNEDDDYEDDQMIMMKEQKDINEGDDLNILEKIWSEILTFTANLIEVFIIPSDNNMEGQKGLDDWIQNLKKGLGIIFICSSEYELQPPEMMSYMSKFNFVLKISECFSQNKNIRAFIKQEMYDQNNEFQFVSQVNYLSIKDIFVNQCDKNKENELVLRLIWQLLKCEDFDDEFIEFEDNILESIMSSLSIILKSLDYNSINNNQEQSHYFIFAKRILFKIVDKMYEDFDANQDEENNDLLEPMFNQSFKKMQRIFEKLKIQKNDPICSLMIDIIGECSYYNEEAILNFIAQKSDVQENIEIDETRANALFKFLVEFKYDNQKVLINIIEFKILQEICQTICGFVHQVYLHNKKEEFQEVEIQNNIIANYNSDRKRKNRMIQILDSSLKQIVNQNQINPITPMIVVKIFKRVFNITLIMHLSDVLESFKNEIFIEKIETQNIWDNTLGQLGVVMYDDLKNHKKLNNLQKQIKIELSNKPQFQFNMTSLISEIILNSDKEEFIQLMSILSSLNPQVVDTKLIADIRDLYMNLLSQKKDFPLTLKKVFVMNLVMTTFLSNDSFIKKMYSQQINIEELFIPFMTDSDVILNIKELLKKESALRRYYCKNCVLLKHKRPMIWSIGPCCMPSEALKCFVCGIIPKILDHYSPDIEPPRLITNKEEPIFVKELNHYPDYSYYYGRDNFPYTGEVQKIDVFIENRGRVDPGFQSQFQLMNWKKLRQITQIEQILFGRVFMLSILCLQFHVIQKEKGKEEAMSLFNNSDSSDIFYGSNEEQGLLSSWNILLQKVQNNDENIMNYYILKIVKNMLIKQSEQQSADKLDFTSDENRIRFESEFVDQILESKDLVNLKIFTELLKKNQQDKNVLKEVILNGKVDTLDDQFESLKEYKHLCRLNTKSTIKNFNNYIFLESKSQESDFFKRIFDYKQQILLYSHIYPIQNWVKIFNQKMFDKITQKESAEIKLHKFVQDYQMKNEFKEFRVSWNFFRKQIQDEEIQIGVDCARILLDDIDNENQKIDIFCYSEDKASRGYPLYLLLKFFKVQHNNYLNMLELDFNTLLNNFSSKKFILMNKKNFIQPCIFENEDNQKHFFTQYIEKFSGHNPLIENEKEEVYDLSELTCEFIEEYYQGVTKIMEPLKTDLERIQLIDFRFKGDQKTINFIREIPDKVDQVMYPDVQNNPQKPLLYIDLQNNETCMKLLDILKITMSIILKINSNQKISGDIYLIRLLSDFAIQVEGINFEREKIKLSHLQHVYELTERISFERLFGDVNPDFLLELHQAQKDELKTFCDQVAIQDQTIFQDAIGRMVVRVLSSQSVPLNAKEGLFKLFLYSSEDFINFWGIEHQKEFERQINGSQWNESYSIFDEQNENMITLGQAFNLYREIQIINQKKHQEENEKIIIQGKRDQIDLAMIEKELIRNNQFVAANQQNDKKKRIKDRNKKDYR